jgi:hypothetical protein
MVHGAVLFRVADEVRVRVPVALSSRPARTDSNDTVAGTASELLGRLFLPVANAHIPASAEQCVGLIFQRGAFDTSLDYFGLIGVPTGPLAGFLMGSLAPGLAGAPGFLAFLLLASSLALSFVRSPGFGLFVTMCA